ncbi:MAG: cold shock domain-containing protein [Acidobacteria bacterium]|nr:cold shock domain-containing protein [Acidobacteriota bacterium]
MKLPVQITWRDMDPSPAVEARIREEAAKLEEFYPRIMGCRVVIEIPHQHRQRGYRFHIRIDLTVPEGEIVVKHEPTLHGTIQKIEEEERTKEREVLAPHKDIFVAISDTFKAARRRLQDFARKQSGAVKHHDINPRASIIKLFPEKGYGFLETEDGEEIYFHRNSVLGGGFDELEIGMEVSFVEEMGEKGPQASTVKVTGKS